MSDEFTFEADLPEELEIIAECAMKLAKCRKDYRDHLLEGEMSEFRKWLAARHSGATRQ